MTESQQPSPLEQAKRQAAFTAGERLVQPGNKLGVGSGSTVKYENQVFNFLYRYMIFNSMVSNFFFTC